MESSFLCEVLSDGSLLINRLFCPAPGDEKLFYLPRKINEVKLHTE